MLKPGLWQLLRTRVSSRVHHFGLVWDKYCMIKLLELAFKELLLLDFSLKVFSLTSVLCFLSNQVWKRKSQCSEKKICTVIQYLPPYNGKQKRQSQARLLCVQAILKIWKSTLLIGNQQS